MQQMTSMENLERLTDDLLAREDQRERDRDIRLYLVEHQNRVLKTQLREAQAVAVLLGAVLTSISNKGGV